MNKVIKISKFICETENGPDCCMACDDDMNGINYGLIYIGRFKLSINLCDKCMKKLKKEIK
jgi:hypothetical protein